MSKKLFQEKQRFTGWDVIALLGFFVIALTYRFLDQNWLNPVEKPLSPLTYSVFVLLLGMALWYFISLKLSVKVTDKTIKVKYSPLQKKSVKIKWEDVDECEFLSYREGTRNSGWNVNYEHERRFSLAGPRGLHLKTKAGDNIFIGVRDLGSLKESIRQVIR